VRFGNDLSYVSLGGFDLVVEFAERGFAFVKETTGIGEGAGGGGFR